MNLRSSITKLTFLFVLLFISTSVFSQDNYVRVETFRVPVTDANTIPTLNHPDKVTAFSYVDGLGRPLQSVAAKAGPNQEDVIAFSTYDPTTGKQVESHLPYTTPSSTPGAFRPLFATEQTAFYVQGGDLASDTKPYSVSDFENSPLGRVKSVIAPGVDYHTNDKKTLYSYFFYAGGADIVHWKLDGAQLPVVATANYGANSVRITQVTTPDGRMAQTIVDGRGLNIASRKWDGTAWNTTYNVYDEMGRLRYIIPPIMANETALSTAQIEGFLFEYKYDNRGRVIESRSPGAGWTYAVYDDFNRLVMTRHDGQKDGTNDSWTFFKYDNFNRQIMSGVVTVGSSENRSSLQTAASTSTLGRYESTANNATGYTTNASFPDLSHVDYDDFELHTISYFDDYSFRTNVGWDAENRDLSTFQPEGFNIQGLPPEGYRLLENNHTVTTPEADDKLAFEPNTTVTIPPGVTLTPGSHIVPYAHTQPAVKGLPTGSKVRILGTDTWLNSVQYYDDRLRPIQTVVENHVGGVDRITSEVNYTTGEVSKTLVEHTGSESVDLLTEYSYDHVGRLLQTHETVGNAARTLVGDYKYNMLGELVEKNIHSTDGGTSFLQSVDYRYNIRKQLTSINNSQLSIGSEATQDVFGMELNYTTGATVNGQSVPGSYDGNIAAISWNSDNDPVTAGIQGGSESIYGYSYDDMNRLTDADYATKSGTTWTGDGGDFDMAASYDDNGNTNTLTRKAAGTTIDSLSYTYEANTNQLKGVADDSNNPEGMDDFFPAPTDYAYDDMGNRTSDLNKEMVEINYNHLQLAESMVFNDSSKVEYVFDAVGNRLSKAVIDADGNTIAKVDYVGLVEYLDNEINQVFIEGGRAYKQNGTYHNEYFIGDHQGNNRVAFGNLPERNIYTAGMEAENSAMEESEFSFPANIRSTAKNHTPLGAESVVLNHAVGRSVGPAKVLTIAAGDHVELQAWARYDQAISATGAFVDVATSILSVLGLSAGDAAAGDAVNAAVGSGGSADVVPVSNPADATDAPDAYLQYVFFDTNYNFISANSGFIKATDAAYNAFEKLEVPNGLDFTQAGYLFVYLANETLEDQEVYFDDIKILHENSTTSFKVSQVNEYYPYGLPTSNSYRAEGYVDPGLLYQAAFSSYDSLTGYYDFQFRNYDPALGQFFAVDPLAAGTSGYSPYHANYNNPVMFTDPLGLAPWDFDPQQQGDPDGPDPTFYMNDGFFQGARWTEWNGSYANYGSMSQFQDAFANAWFGAHGNKVTSTNFSNGTVSSSNSFVINSSELDPNSSNFIGNREEYWIDFETSNYISTAGVVVSSPRSLFNSMAFLGDFLVGANDAQEGTFNNDAVAIFVGPDLDIFGFTGGSISGGGIKILQGPDKGKLIPFVDVGIGWGGDVSIALKFGNFKYTGNIDNLRAEAFYGWREETNIGLGYKLDITFSFTKSEPYRGGILYGEAFSVGAGFSFNPAAQNQGRTYTPAEFISLFFGK